MPHPGNCKCTRFPERAATRNKCQLLEALVLLRPPAHFVLREEDQTQNQICGFQFPESVVSRSVRCGLRIHSFQFLDSNPRFPASHF